MTRCPECHSVSQAEAPYCSACLYRFTIDDHARRIFERRRLKYRIGAVAIGLSVAILHYALRG